MSRPLQRPHRRAVLLAAVATLFIAVGCGDDEATGPYGGGEPIDRGPQTSIMIPAGEPIVIGISTALTGGPNAERGMEYRDAAIVAIERWKNANGAQIAGHDIQVRAEDDGCGASYTDAAGETRYVAVDAADSLLAIPGLVGVIGPQCSSGSLAAIPAYDDAGIVMISGSATTTSLTEDQPEGRFFFRTAYRNDLEGTLIGIFVGGSPELGIDSAVIIDNGETYGQDLANAAAQVSEEFGLTVMRDSIVEGTVDFSATVARIMAADPAFVGFAGFNPEASLLYSQLRDAGYDGIFGAGDGAASLVSFVGPVGAENAEGVLFAGCTVPLPQDFLDEFLELHGHQPSAAFPAQYADAATILLDAVAAVAQVEEDGSLLIQPATLRDAVRATSLEGGLSGAIAFDAFGDRRPPGVKDLDEFLSQALAGQDPTGYEDLGLIPCQVQDGKLVNLLGPNAGEFRLP